MLLYPNAKINIGLNIIEKREDGYHNIETVFYPIGLCDILDIEPSDSCSDYSFSSSGIPISGDPEENLIVKSIRLLQSQYEIPPVDISLIKQIPFGAGLGGGSSDAAFTLKAINEIFNLKITKYRLEKIASILGADCPVFIKNKTIYATGIGNVFSPIKLKLKGYFLLLVKPDIHVSTSDAYSLVVPKLPEISLFESISQPIHEWKNLIKNDFEASVFKKYPEIAEIKKNLYKSGAIYASMSGSGSSVYGLFKDELDRTDIFANYFVTGGYLQ